MRSVLWLCLWGSSQWPIRATILHIPVIMLVFGGYWWWLIGLVLHYEFLQRLPICFHRSGLGGVLTFVFIGITTLVPRVLIGLVSSLVYKSTEKISKKTSMIIFILIQIFAFLANLWQTV